MHHTQQKLINVSAGQSQNIILFQKLSGSFVQRVAEWFISIYCRQDSVNTIVRNLEKSCISFLSPLQLDEFPDDSLLLTFH